MLSRFRLLGVHFPLRTSPSRLNPGVVAPYCLGTRRYYSSPQPWRRVIYDQGNLPLRQGGMFDIHLPHSVANIKLKTTWQEKAKVLLLVDGNNPSYIFDDEADRDPGAMVVMDTEQNRLSINEVQLSCHEDLHIQKKLDIIVEIPQVCNVKLHSGSGSIRILPKLEGDLSLSTTGDVTLDVVRGDQISLTCNGSLLKAKEIQAQDLSMECQMNVVSQGTLKFGSLYSNSSSIKAVGIIAVGTSHGKLSVQSDKGSAFIGGVSGSLHATAFRDIIAHFDVLGPRSKSNLTSLTSSIHVSCAEGITANVYTEGKGRLNVKTPNWDPETDVTTEREGKIVGVSSLDSPSKWRMGGINAETARMHCLDLFDNGQGSTEEDNSATTSTSDDEPMLTLNASREISLKTLNFMQVESLKKQHMHQQQ